MIIVGLTGSIAMGKSTVADLFSQQGVPIISADDIVHQLYQSSAVPLIEAAFPGSTKNQKVDREVLMQSLSKDPSGFKKLETIIHPLVRKTEWEFINQQKAAKAELIILEIPLLYETEAENLMDTVILVSAPLKVQKQRALSRKNMTLKKFESLLAKQMPDSEKRRNAEYIIETNKPLEETKTDVAECLLKIKENTKANAYKSWKNQQY